MADEELMEEMDNEGALITLEDEEIELSIGGEEEEQELSEFFRNWIEKTD